MKRRIHTGLTEAGLLPPGPSMLQIQKQAFAAGEDVLSDVAALTGRAGLLIGLNACRFPGWASDGTSLAGWGFLISNFALLPVVPSAAERRRLAGLGALAHLIVALYDHAQDHLPSGTLTLSAAELQRWLAQDQLQVRKAISLRRPVDHLIRQLVQAYLVQLQALPGISLQPGLLRFTHRLIAHLFAADPVPAVGITPAGARRALVIRDVFPFLILGVPGWTVTPSPAARLAHFLFLYRYGRFIGLLDDAMDMAGDVWKGHPNLFVTGLAPRDGGHGPAADRIARHLAQRGLAVRRAWIELSAGCSPRQREEMLSVFQHSLLSWFSPYPETL